MKILHIPIYARLLLLLLALGLNSPAWADWQTQKLSPTESIQFPGIPEKSPNHNWSYTQAATAEQPGMSMYVTILPLPWWMRTMISITDENVFADNEIFHKSMIDAMKKQSNKDGNGPFTNIISDNFELNGFHGIEIEALRTTSSGKTQQLLVHAMFLNGQIFLYGISFAPQDSPPQMP